ncbi:hypothetical protein K438DRAFT_2083444 [Mycena galopus ATCC 62051]|nr:hypothetical protein K438DRAFT_2083444 [Mycena galopus ATCC 62051]
MPFAKTSTCSPQTVKTLARMHVKVPDSSSSSNPHSIVSWLQPRKVARPRLAVGYRRVMHTAPPAALPTLRHLSIGRRHSTPSSVTQDTSDRSPAPTHPHATGGPDVCDIPTSNAGFSVPRAKGGLAATSSIAKKPYLYESQRNASGSPRCANHLCPPLEPVSQSPKPSTGVSRRPAAPPPSHTDAGSLPETRRHGVPVFDNDIQDILKDVLRLKDREEQEEKLLTELLNGRVVGGEGKYQRIKMVPASERVDASAAWMTTLF